MTSISRPAKGWSVWSAAVCLLAVGVVGCGAREPSYCVVTGTVLVNEEPAGGVYLQFHGPDGSQKDSVDGGKTDPDGSFRINLHEPGKYTVTATWPTVTIVEGEEFEGADQFAATFSIPSRSGLKMTVPKEGTALPPIRFTYP